MKNCALKQKGGKDYHQMTYCEGIRFDYINDESEYRTILAYGQSKLSNIFHAKELARCLKEEAVEIIAKALHPGAIATNLLRFHSFINAVTNSVAKFVLKNVQQGVATQCYVALNPQVKGVSGDYFVDTNIANPTSHAKDIDLAKKLRFQCVYYGDILMASLLESNTE